MSVEQILNSLVAYHNHVAAFAIVHIFWNPCIAERHVRSLGEHVIAVVACIVLEVPKSPVCSGQFRSTSNHRILTVGTTDFNRIVGGRAAWCFVTEIYSSDTVQRYSCLPCLTFREEI